MMMAHRPSGPRRDFIVLAIAVALAASTWVSVGSLAPTAGYPPATASPLPEWMFTTIPEAATPTLAPTPTVAPPLAATQSPRPSAARSTPRPRPTASPTRRPVSVAPRGAIVGLATWYCLAGVSRCMAAHPGGLYAAAGPALRAVLGPDWRGRVVTVWMNGRHVTVTLADSCGVGCQSLIDLYADAMVVIDPGYRINGGGTVKVTW